MNDTKELEVQWQNSTNKMIAKYKKLLKEYRAERRWASDWDTKPFKRNAYMVSHGKIKILNQIIKDLKTLIKPTERVEDALTYWNDNFVNLYNDIVNVVTIDGEEMTVLELNASLNLKMHYFNATL